MNLQLAALTLIAFVAPPPPAWRDPTPDQIQAAILKSLPLLEKGAVGHVTHRQCFACHNQALPMLAMSTAWAQGFTVNEREVERQLRFIADFLGRNRENYKKGRGQGGQADTAGYALFTLEIGGWKPDDTTSAVTEYLLLRDREFGHWVARARRPPSENSSFTTTYHALRALQQFGTPEQKDRIAERTSKARRWLLNAIPRDTEDRVFRLRALKRAGADEKDIRAAAQELIKTQRKDGGWSQLDKMDSDAYATGSALVALHEAGGMPVSDPVYQRGVKFLVNTQLEDGSWKVRSRSRPFQVYFESGFPHGKDQFISLAASGWATTALALAHVPEVDATKRERLKAPTPVE